MGGWKGMELSQHNQLLQQLASCGHAVTTAFYLLDNSFFWKRGLSLPVRNRHGCVKHAKLPERWSG